MIKLTLNIVHLKSKSMKSYFCAFLLIAILSFNSCSKKDSTPKPLSVTVSTLAGSGSQGSSNGAGQQASFTAIWGITVDAAGNVYVTDTGLNQVRKISPSGVVTTLPDNGPGSTNANGIPTIYENPLGVAIDATGNLYVSYLASSVVRKISTSGAGEILAQDLTVGTPNGLQQPLGLALDASGNLYVAGYSSCSIIQISPSGLVNTFAGVGLQGNTNGSKSTARFNVPDGVAVDAKGNVYVADTGNNEIRKISTSGIVTTLAGSVNSGSSNGLGASASFFAPTGIAVDGGGNLYVADCNNNLIRKITPSGLVSTLAGTGSAGSANGAGNNASFNEPVDLAMGPDGNLYVADRGSNMVRKITIN